MKSLRWTIGSSSRLGLIRVGLIRRCLCETTNKGGGGGNDGKDTSTDDTKNNAPIPTVSNTGGGPGTMSERGEETRGALKIFMATQKEGMKGDGLWARLRREANPVTTSFQQQQQQQQPSSRSSSSGEGEDGVSTPPPRRTWSSPRHPQSLRPSSPDPSGGERGNVSDGQQRGRMPTEQRNTSRSSDGDSSVGTMNRPPPRRSFNPRGGAKGNSAPRVFASVSSDDGGNNFAGGGGGCSSGGRKKRRGTGPEGEGSGGGGRFGDTMPPAVKAMLDDDAFFQAIQKGYSIDTRGLDGIDVFLAEVYLNSLKTHDGRVRTVVESPGLRRTQLPKPRPIHQLIASMRPMITSVPEGSEGHKLGTNSTMLISGNLTLFDPYSYVLSLLYSDLLFRTYAYFAGAQAWQAISRNYYIREADKVSMCNQIAMKRGDLTLLLNSTLTLL